MTDSTDRVPDSELAEIRRLAERGDALTANNDCSAELLAYLADKSRLCRLVSEIENNRRWGCIAGR